MLQRMFPSAYEPHSEMLNPMEVNIFFKKISKTVKIINRFSGVDQNAHSTRFKRFRLEYTQDVGDSGDKLKCSMI